MLVSMILFDSYDCMQFKSESYLCQLDAKVWEDGVLESGVAGGFSAHMHNYVVTDWWKRQDPSQEGGHS